VSDDTEKLLLDGVKRGFLIGVSVLVVLGGLGFFAARALVTKTHDMVRAGWTLTPVLVAKTDLNKGAELTAETLEPRAIPSVLVTANSLQPSDAAKVAGQRIKHALYAGAPIRWSDVRSTPLKTVLFATRDIVDGARLTAADVEERSIAADIPNASWVVDKRDVIGRVTVAPFLRGDPILTTHFAP